MALPMPVAPPVTRATFPEKSPVRNIDIFVTAPFNRKIKHFVKNNVELCLSISACKNIVFYSLFEKFPAILFYRVTSNGRNKLRLLTPN